MIILIQIKEIEVDMHSDSLDWGPWNPAPQTPVGSMIFDPWDSWGEETRFSSGSHSGPSFHMSQVLGAPPNLFKDHKSSQALLAMNVLSRSSNESTLKENACKLQAHTPLDLTVKSTPMTNLLSNDIQGQQQEFENGLDALSFAIEQINKVYGDSSTSSDSGTGSQPENNIVSKPKRRRKRPSNSAAVTKSRQKKAKIMKEMRIKIEELKKQAMEIQERIQQLSNTQIIFEEPLLEEIPEEVKDKKHEPRFKHSKYESDAVRKEARKRCNRETSQRQRERLKIIERNQKKEYEFWTQTVPGLKNELDSLIKNREYVLRSTIGTNIIQGLLIKSN